MNKLDDRLKKILRIIVQSHIDLNSPVGSILIAKKFPLGLSPATIRNTMAKLEKLGYRRERTVIKGAEEPAHVTLPGVHRISSLLKRWLMGTHQGAVNPKQLDYYLDEFTFRFNRRTSRSRGLLFYRLLQQALLTEPVTYAQITAKAKHNI